MPHFSYTVDNGIVTLTMDSGENRFNPFFLKEYSSVLDAIETEDAQVMVVTSAHQHIFSTGIDLDWVLPVLRSRDTQSFYDYLSLMNSLMKRLTLFPLFTIAAINGHAFAGGAVLSCCFDFRFMQTGRGYFCLPEIDLGVPFLPGMVAVLKKAMPMDALEELQYTGKRFTAEECAARRIIHAACPPSGLMDTAMAFASNLRKRRNVIAEMKRVMYRDVLRAIDEEDPVKIEQGWHEWFTNIVP
ncbi:MAG TPA: enoyl-CoA hydratase/isomerase family protein [Deltaproteobacteria bacterium]|nr:enoyl-CoA hydratase/isomerase family protein [Deltaproteobacteria bacterium]HPR56351.1 enoyl-CoA hydratase/isomerase family protein [Deltaproteobacteria bacterium]HXK46055.1 enoyl-CoA hydratase/isomerase family protein [Deltaproteobacteria bacterium]